MTVAGPATPENAMRAALTGHMVLSTLHTNTPEAAVDRLKDLGVPGCLIEGTLRGVLGQRLVERSNEALRNVQAAL
ncbi:MAG: ATPase, T2SS/T4P/T4SS family, partial [Pseudomonadota bacterium]